MRNFQRVVHAVLVAPAIVMLLESLPGTLASQLQEDQQQQQERQQQQAPQENRGLNLVTKSRLYDKHSRDWAYSNNDFSNDGTNPPTEVVVATTTTAAATTENTTTTVSDVSIDTEPRSSSGFVQSFLRTGKGSKKKDMIPKSWKGQKSSKKGDDDKPSMVPTEAPIQSGPGPSPVPTSRPTTSSPTTSVPTSAPTRTPTSAPTRAPTSAPTTPLVLPTVPPTPVPTQSPTTPQTPVPSPEDTAPPTTFSPTTWLPTTLATTAPPTTWLPTTWLPTTNNGQVGALSMGEFQALEAIGVVTNENKQQVTHTRKKQGKQAKAAHHERGAAAGKHKDKGRKNRLGLIDRGFGGD
mmetsp:Transcript_27924/g.61513  ORF Transcript_27924/g.61513 Transcript_27924/m.61513 type:complete len:351 (+) Transcript_27924:263-1315(+)